MTLEERNKLEEMRNPSDMIKFTLASILARHCGDMTENQNETTAVAVKIPNSVRNEINTVVHSVDRELWPEFKGAFALAMRDFLLHGALDYITHLNEEV